MNKINYISLDKLVQNIYNQYFAADVKFDSNVDAYENIIVVHKVEKSRKRYSDEQYRKKYRPVS